jgi:hypothetical protein
MFNAKLSVYIFPLALLSPVAHNHWKLPGSAASSALHAVNEPLISASALRITLSTALSAPSASAGHQDSTLVTSIQQHEAKPEAKPALEKPKYTCPENDGRDEDVFFCVHCGGAKNVTPCTNDGEPNAKCIGVSHWDSVHRLPDRSAKVEIWLTIF